MNYYDLRAINCQNTMLSFPKYFSKILMMLPVDSFYFKRDYYNTQFSSFFYSIRSSSSIIFKELYTDGSIYNFGVLINIFTGFLS